MSNKAIHRFEKNVRPQIHYLIDKHICCKLDKKESNLTARFIYIQNAESRSDFGHFCRYFTLFFAKMVDVNFNILN